MNKSLVLKKRETLSRQDQMRTLWRNSFAQSSKRKGRQMRPHSEERTNQDKWSDKAARRGRRNAHSKLGTLQ